MNGTKELDPQKVLHSDFDMNIHKEVFTNYLEVVILKDGKIEYAVPSHNNKMAEIYMKQCGLNNIHEAMDRIPKEYHFDMIEWFNIQTGAISVWNNYFMGRANKKQLAVLRKLKMFGLYKGPIKNPPIDRLTYQI